MKNFSKLIYGLIINEFIEKFIYKKKKINKIKEMKTSKMEESKINEYEGIKICRANYCDILKIKNNDRKK